MYNNLCYTINIQTNWKYNRIGSKEGGFCMPVVGNNDVENYVSFQSDFNFLVLKNDKEIKEVRFLLNSADDVKHYIVLQVKNENGKYRYVDCLKLHNEPLDNCPFCKHADAVAKADRKASMIMKKVFLPVYDIEADDIKIFERGSGFIKETLEPVIRRNAPIVGVPCEIERQGVPKSMDTFYNVFAIPNERDDKTIADFGEVPELMGSYILQLTFEEMEDYLKTGKLPKTEATAAEDKAENLPRRTRRGEGATAEPATEEDAKTARRRARTGEIVN